MSTWPLLAPMRAFGLRGTDVSIRPPGHSLLQKALIFPGTQKVSIWYLGKTLLTTWNLVLKVLTFLGPFCSHFRLTNTIYIIWICPFPIRIYYINRYIIIFFWQRTYHKFVPPTWLLIYCQIDYTSFIKISIATSLKNSNLRSLFFVVYQGGNVTVSNTVLRG